MPEVEFGNLAEIIGVAVLTQSRLDTSRAFFLSINPAVIGAVALIKHTFSRMEKTVAIMTYYFAPLLIT